MRLIDADALIEQMKADAEHLEESLFKMSTYAAINDVKHQPTIEPERKKGRWIEHNPHKWGLGIVFECSECGEKIECEPSNFCPNCGAKMEE